MRLITGGLTTILATLALASSTFAAVNTNTLTGTVGPGFTITMNKKTVKAGTLRDHHPRPRDRSTTST